MKEKWIEVDPFGSLYFESILVYFNEPDLFVCTDQSEKKYLGVFLDENKEMHLLVETDNQNILCMINKEISMEQAFRKTKGGKAFYILYDAVTDRFASREVKISQVQKEDLPESNVLFTLNDGNIQNYRSLLQEQIKLM
ncbi:hypothetical protein [Oscillibacter sp.]|uniref:hypothetical protein n=1 Tax=Oscillibacter sp. TaxID=1945593 RepID=UPI0033962D6A